MTHAIGSGFHRKQPHADLANTGGKVAENAFNAQDKLMRGYEAASGDSATKRAWLARQGVDVSNLSDDQLDGPAQRILQKLQIGAQRANEMLAAFQELAKNMHEMMMRMIQNLKLS